MLKIMECTVVDITCTVGEYKLSFTDAKKKQIYWCCLQGDITAVLEFEFGERERERESQRDCFLKL